jgi:hypothetical protein
MVSRKCGEKLKTRIIQLELERSPRLLLHTKFESMDDHAGEFPSILFQCLHSGVTEPPLGFRLHRPYEVVPKQPFKHDVTMTVIVIAVDVIRVDTHAIRSNSRSC